MTKTSLNKDNIVFEEKDIKQSARQAMSPNGMRTQNLNEDITDEKKLIKMPGTAEAKHKRQIVEMPYNVHKSALFENTDDFKSGEKNASS